MVSLFLLIIGCSGGFNVETLIEELRIVATVVDPPEANPGEMVNVTLHIADPSASSPQVASWTCGGFSDTCLETDPNRADIATQQGQAFTAQVLIPMEAEGLLQDFNEVVTSVWSLACEEDVCPLITNIANGTVTNQQLSEPATSLQELPMTGVSLARRSLWISNRTSDRRTNPTITPNFEVPINASPGESIPLTFTTSGTTDIGYGYATAGGFETTDEPIIDGQLSMTWIAPDIQASATLWVVTESTDTGSAVWSSEILIQ